ncbi:hypothetical protein HY636_04815 [Candidatus Woesearchaeota archaeon]|nr:hypothetical protein [Candidatus Woesearchaeota archaeon]
MQENKQEKQVGYEQPNADYIRQIRDKPNLLRTVVAVVGLGGILLGNVASAKDVDSIDKAVSGTDSSNTVIQKVTNDTNYTTCYPCYPCDPARPCRPTCAPY